MKNLLKNFLIPNEENNNIPRFLSDKVLKIILITVIFIEAFGFVLPTLTDLSLKGEMAAVLPSVLNDLTNIERESENLKTLTINPILNQAAQMKADDMALNEYFAHTSPEGKTPWFWLEKAGYDYRYAGENLAINFSESEDITKAWMNSPTHRANIVKENYTEIGTATATGSYQGREAVYVVQVYANPIGQEKISAEKVVVDKVDAENNKIKEEDKTEKVLGAEDLKGEEVKTGKIEKADDKTEEEKEKKEEEEAEILVEEEGGVEIKTKEKTNFFYKMGALFQGVLGVYLFILSILIFISLLIYTITNRKKIDQKIILKGLGLIIVLMFLLFFNNYIGSRNSMKSTSIDYSKTEL